MQREQEWTAPLTTAGFPVSSSRSDPARLAESPPRASMYAELRNVRCDFHEGGLLCAGGRPVL